MLLSWSFVPSLARRISDKSGIQHKKWRSATVDAGVMDRLSTTVGLWMSAHVGWATQGRTGTKRQDQNCVILVCQCSVNTRLQRAAQHSNVRGTFSFSQWTVSKKTRGRVLTINSSLPNKTWLHCTISLCQISSSFAMFYMIQHPSSVFCLFLGGLSAVPRSDLLECTR